MSRRRKTRGPFVPQPDLAARFLTLVDRGLATRGQRKYAQLALQAYGADVDDKYDQSFGRAEQDVQAENQSPKR